MYGLLIEAVVDYAKKRFGDAVWEKVRTKAKLDTHTYLKCLNLVFVLKFILIIIKNEDIQLIHSTVKLFF